jgi:two-component system response regulator DctR
MQPVLNACVFIIDDDAIVRDAMAWLLRSRRLMSESFDSADAFERMLSDKFPGPNAPVPTEAGCILLDVRMPGQSGLALFETLIGNGGTHLACDFFKRSRRCPHRGRQRQARRF